MKLTDEDIKKFYYLYIRLNNTSPNIGIIGSDRKFNAYIKEILGEYKKTTAKIIINKDKTIYRILINDQEYTYIHIKTTEDLQGRTFRKFI